MRDSFAYALLNICDTNRVRYTLSRSLRRHRARYDLLPLVERRHMSRSCATTYAMLVLLILYKWCVCVQSAGGCAHDNVLNRAFNRGLNKCWSNRAAVVS